MMMNPSDELCITGITKRYGKSGGVTALENVNLSIAPGELLVLLGPSGCGKTTLLRSVAGLEVPDHGSIRLRELTIFDAETKTNLAPERRGVGMVFQNYALWPHMTVLDNVAYPLRSRREKKGAARATASELLDRLDVGGLTNRLPAELSGGQQQRVAVARGLAGEPDVVLFDEPLSNIDAQLRAKVRTEIRQLHARLGFTAIWVTHDQEEALEMADRIVVMERGKIAQIGTPEEVYNSPANSYVASFIGIDNTFSVQQDSGAGRESSSKVDSDFGSLIGQWSSLFSEGSADALELYCRANRVRVSQPNDNTIPSDHVGLAGGEIVDIVFSGDTYREVIKFPGGEIVGISDRAPIGRNVGDVVNVMFRLDDLHVFDAD